DRITGLPRRTMVKSEEIREALADPVKQITAAARRTLEKTPPELSADLVRTGVTLAGGGSLLRKIDVAIQDAIQLPVRIAEDPMTCVARGTFEFLSQLHLYSQVLPSGDDN